VLFSEPKIPQFQPEAHSRNRHQVSVLFSEPKIPQSSTGASVTDGTTTFQCSSASRKFLNAPERTRTCLKPPSFSALQRAENSSITHNASPACSITSFQCSSASRKFLNCSCCTAVALRRSSFSALQRAENSSMQVFIARRHNQLEVSVLFSEPKIPQ